MADSETTRAAELETRRRALVAELERWQGDLELGRWRSGPSLERTADLIHRSRWLLEELDPASVPEPDASELGEAGLERRVAELERQVARLSDACGERGVGLGERVTVLERLIGSPSVHGARVGVIPAGTDAVVIPATDGGAE